MVTIRRAQKKRGIHINTLRAQGMYAAAPAVIQMLTGYKFGKLRSSSKTLWDPNGQLGLVGQ